MSPESLWIHPAARDEAEAATDWYAQRSRWAAERFLDELDSAVDHILRNPGRYPASEHGTGRMVLQRFPSVIVFREAAARLEIIAVAHGRRSPGYWRDRWDERSVLAGVTSKYTDLFDALKIAYQGRKLHDPALTPAPPTQLCTAG